METLGLTASGVTLKRRGPIELLWLRLGLVVYAVRLFLPAVFLPEGSGGRLYYGLQCAIECIDTYPPLLLSGLINPLAAAYVFCRASDVAPRLRRGLAAATLTLIPCTWWVMAGFHLHIRIGHVLWVVGLLLMLGPEALLGQKRARLPASG